MNYMYKLFIWFSGSDEELLDRCTALERKKYAMYGAMILIPTIAAFISMRYALSTFVDNITFYTVAAVLWAGAIFIIDRFIISTFHKGKRINSGNTAKFLVRFLFAAILGVIISHPIVLLFFEQNIDERLETNYYTEIEESRVLREQQFEESDIYNRLAESDSLISCLQKLVSAEASGFRVELPCGYTTGTRSCGPVCRLNQGTLASEETKRRLILEEVEVEKRKYDELYITDTLVNQLRTDYITRMSTLEELKNESDHIWYAQVGIFLLFFLIDLIPLTFKSSGSRTDYDTLVDEKRYLKIKAFEIESKHDEDVQKDILKNLYEYKNAHIIDIFESNYDRNLDQISAIISERFGLTGKNLYEELIDKKQNNVKTTTDGFLNRAKSVTTSVLEHPITIMGFVTVLSLGVGYYLFAEFKNNITALGVFAPFFTSVIANSIALYVGIKPKS